MPADGGFLVFWVIYDRPRDYPDSVVLRRHVSGPSGSFADPVASLAATVEAARNLIPDWPVGYVNVRHPSDDPVIVEVWV